MDAELISEFQATTHMAEILRLGCAQTRSQVAYAEKILAESHLAIRRAGKALTLSEGVRPVGPGLASPGPQPPPEAGALDPALVD